MVELPRSHGGGCFAPWHLGLPEHSLVFSGRRDREGEETATLIRAAGAECLFIRSDVSDEKDVKALVHKTIKTYGRLDFAFNNAGIDSPVKPLHKQLIKEFDKLMAVNVRGMKRK